MLSQVLCQTKKGRPSNTPSPKPIPVVTTSLISSNNLFLDEIKVLSGKQFLGNELFSDFNTKSIQLDEKRSKCKESSDWQIDIQYFPKICRDTRDSTILQRFLTDTIQCDRPSKTASGASEINVGNNYKPGTTAIVAFVKTAN